MDFFVLANITSVFTVNNNDWKCILFYNYINFISMKYEFTNEQSYDMISNIMKQANLNIMPYITTLVMVSALHISRAL